MASTTDQEATESLIEERDRLREEVSTLATQMKLLVRAEHGLTRSRRDLDQQLHRIRVLAAFALSATGTEETEEVLARAQQALLDSFQLDGALALRLDAAKGELWTQVGRRPLAGQALTTLKELQVPGLGGPEAGPAATLMSALAELGGQPMTSEASVIVWVPVRTAAHGLVAVLVGWSRQQRSYYRDVPAASHLPFLELLATHLNRALDSAQLTAELRHQGAALTEANRDLKRSVEDLERTQAQLVQAQKLEALGRLAGGIAHDFNNLLTVIVSHAEMLRDAVEGNLEASEDVQVIIDTTRRATEITRRLLAFGRKQENRQGLVDLNALTVDVSKLLRRLIGDDVVLQLDLDPSIGKVGADAVQLEQIIMNLAVNARDAMPRGGKLTVETRWAQQSDAPDLSTRVANMIAWSVIDEGTGMDDVTRSQLFEPFFTTKEVGKGSGLGLATVYGLVTQNRGHISVHSEPGKGTRFAVLLPTVDAGARLESPAPVGSRGWVLVVEDEDAIRRIVARVLRARGFQVAEAREGREALDLVKRIGHIDLVVTDVVMPRMTGPEMVQVLRESMPDVEVIFMSGHTFDRLKVEALDPEHDHFLPKPFTPQELSRLLEDVVASSQGGPERRTG